MDSWPVHLRRLGGIHPCAPASMFIHGLFLTRMRRPFGSAQGNRGLSRYSCS